MLGVVALFLVARRLMKSEAEPLLKVSMGYKIENGSIILPNKTPNAQSVALEDGTSASLWWTLCWPCADPVQKSRLQLLV